MLSTFLPAFAGPGFVRVEGTRIVAPDGTALALRGINLGNWLVPEGYMFGFDKALSPRQIRGVLAELVGPEAADWFLREWRERFIQPEDLAFIRASGLNLVRVPIDFRLLTPEEHPGVWLEEGFALLDRLVAWSAREGLHVLLDLHAAPCGQTGTDIDNSYGVAHIYEDEACRARTGEVWERIAARYAGNSTVIGYDLLNEPLPEGDSRREAVLADLYRDLTARIRRVDPNHLIFIGGARWNTDFTIFENPRFDDRLVYTFHHYITEPSGAVLEPYLSFSRRHGVPLFLGEAGENHDGWIEAMRRLLEAEGIGWAFWPYKKMSGTSSLRRYDRPVHWDAIVAYQALLDEPPAKRIAKRPPIAHARAALADLLERVAFARTHPNKGFIRALGLDPPR